MKNSAKYLLIFILCSYNVYSQNDINNVFKTMLILDGCIKQEIKKQESDISLLNKNIQIEIDELISKRIEKIFYPYYFEDYQIFSFTVGKNKIISNETFYLNSSSCKTYILIFNIKNKRYYRVKGFNANDFNHLLADIINSNRIEISEREIVQDLDDLKLDGLDFQCLYKALKDSPKKRMEYPCMATCTAPSVIK